MKALAFLGMMVLVTPLVQATDTPRPAGRFINATVEQSEQSLKLALESNSVGLQVSAAQTARDLKALLPREEFSSLIIPLMRIVKNEDAETPCRIVAAIALHNLRSERGDFAIERAAQFTGNERVKHVCSWLSFNRRHGEGLRPAGAAPAMKEMLGMIRPEPMPDTDARSGS